MSAGSVLSTALWQLGTVSFAATAVSVVLVSAGPHGDEPVAYGYPAVGALYAAAGLLAWWRRPRNRLGALWVATGGAYVLAGLQNTADEVLVAVGLLTSSLPLAMLVHLLHAYPSGRLEGRGSRATVVGAYVVALLLQVPQWAFAPADPPYDLLQVASREELAIAGYLAQVLCALVLVVLTVRLLLRRLRQFSRGHRRVLAPLFAYGVLAVVTPSLAANLLRPLVGEITQAAVVEVVLAGVPVVFVAAMLRGGFAGTGSTGGFATAIVTSDGPHQLEEALAANLGDPSARLLAWSADRRTYVDSLGSEAPLPAGDESRAAVRIGEDDRRLGAIVYDPVLNPDPAPVASVARVAAVALDRVRLAAEVSASRQALLETSARLVGEGDRERRRIVRDLHDGLQIALVRLSMQAHQLAQDVPGADTPALAARLAADVDAAADALRALIQGVMPAPLLERGLDAAVRDLAQSLPLRVTVETEGLTGRLPAPVESTAYFVVAEALTNVLKHSRARRVTIGLSCLDDTLSVDVRDDGVGGADHAAGGTGLAGLRDRLHVLGGDLSLTDAHPGTRVEAVLPCG